jgi:hypothetical protein
MTHYTVKREKGPDGTEYEKREPYTSPAIAAGRFRIVERATGNPLILTPGQWVNQKGERATKEERAKKDQEFTRQEYLTLKNPADHMHATTFATADEAAEWARANVHRDTHKIEPL